MRDPDDHSLLTRREMLRLTASAVAGCALAAGPALSAPGGARKLGIGMHSYGFNWKAAKENQAEARFHDALSFLAYAREIHAGGVQVTLSPCDADCAKKLRADSESWGLYLEAQSVLPRRAADVSRFEDEVRTAAAAGAVVMRTASMPGRRYEVFRDQGEFREFARATQASLELAEPIMRRHRVRLAVENHKDWRTQELVALLRKLGSEFIGVTLDFGNSIALLEDPMQVVEALAPLAFSTHVKDMAVREYEEGFLLAEVPLGTGFLDLRRMIEICLKANPRIRFNLEMITRDPLRIPCLNENYWKTFGEVPASDLARTLAIVRKNRSEPPQISARPFSEQLSIEDSNVRKSIEFFNQMNLPAASD